MVFADKHVVAVSVSQKRGQKKSNVQKAFLKKGWGLLGDIHADGSHRQMSLLAFESIQRFRRKSPDVVPGDFAENVTTAGIDLAHIAVGTCLRIGEEAVIRITQIGKNCHGNCEIFKLVGDCVMPKEGVFAEVIQSGSISPGSKIDFINQEDLCIK